MQKNSQDRFIYESVVSMLQEKKPVQSIAKHVGIAKSTVYEIQKRISQIHD
ncbi:helix-turn-helix domain-containing protein [Gemella haemolysans]|uniref:helix-turn-helix domain-containing protein n=1 Tax=Gemella haemolysans TaxID=1379 RepID=UPI001EF9DA70|nr:helix-turn-helix domain-containing protein [Gemella haemolysans]